MVQKYFNYLPLAGVANPVGVRGRDPAPLGVVTPNLLAVVRVAGRVFVVTLRIGILEGVPKSSAI